jgi:Cu-processing system permease protein
MLVGGLIILLSAIVIGYGATALLIAVSGSDSENWQAYSMMMASSWMLGGIFIALGYVISVFVRERATAAGAAIGVWLIGVVLYDLGLMGLLLADEEQIISEGLFSTLIVANPTDAYRIFNLTGFETTRHVAGLADIGENAAIAPWLLLAVMAAWLLLPLVVTILRFGRREL